MALLEEKRNMEEYCQEIESDVRLLSRVYLTSSSQFPILVPNLLPFCLSTSSGTESECCVPAYMICCLCRLARRRA